jgi:hypothetical protein
MKYVAIFFFFLVGLCCKSSSKLTNENRNSERGVPVKLSVVSNFFKDSIEKAITTVFKKQNKKIISEEEFKQLITQGFGEIFNSGGGSIPTAKQDFNSRQNKTQSFVENLVVKAVCSSSNKLSFDSLSYKCYYFPGQVDIKQWQAPDSILHRRTFPELMEILVNAFLEMHK